MCLEVDGSFGSSGLGKGENDLRRERIFWEDWFGWRGY